MKISKGLITAVLTIAAMAATILGKSQLAAFLGSPEAAESLTIIVTAGGTLVAGVLEGVKKEKVSVEVAPVSKPAAAKRLSAGKA